MKGTPASALSLSTLLSIASPWRLLAARRPTPGRVDVVRSVELAALVADERPVCVAARLDGLDQDLDLDPLTTL
jgi:hypothetical protein